MRLFYKIISAPLVCVFSFISLAQEKCEDHFQSETSLVEEFDISTSEGLVGIMANEFAGFHRQPSMVIIGKVQLQNRFLRMKEARPEFTDREAYEAWLMERQRSGIIPEHPYGYRVVEVISLAMFKDRGHHKMKPRIAPIWINNTNLFYNNEDTQREYMNWAEEYYQKSRFYPPGYLNWVRDQVQIRLILQGDSEFDGRIKEDRRLKDVVLSLGGKRKTTSEEERTASKLTALIQGLTGNDMWIDVGTGSGYVLEDSILGLHEDGRDINGIPHTLGITYEPTLSDIEQITTVQRPNGTSVKNYRTRVPEELSSKHRMWSHRLLQDIPNEELPKAKLITDFYGAFSYSADPASEINKYINVIDKDGTIGIVYSNSEVVKLKDESVSFHEWLKSIFKDQISIEHGTSWIRSPGSPVADEEGYIEAGYILIRNPSGNSIELPSLEQVAFGSKDSRFKRIFRPTADIITSK